MEYILKIKTKFDCMISLNNFNRRKLCENSFQTFKLTLNENENLTLFVEPITKSENLILPYNVYIKNSGKYPFVPTPFLFFLSGYCTVM